MFAPSPRRSSKSFFQNLSSCTNQAWFMQKDHFNLEQDAWPACPEPQWEVVGDGAVRPCSKKRSPVRITSSDVSEDFLTLINALYTKTKIMSIL